ncbi:hypothetical protein EJ08DRAFT_646197 [Tothia fuscella]|uniref:Mesaconyl-C(4)-CoA hydratase n=1 Tax=Tothia fuscella TaxID=1048955 RepID=A0A9P4NYE8_9PEZI|nr:hypothetical protein EJ08DRAFT_646197 [Tothia fuscella]
MLLGRLHRAHQIPLITSRRWQSTTTPSTPDFDALKTTLLQRKLPILYDKLYPEQAHKLNRSLQSYFPDSWIPHWPGRTLRVEAARPSPLPLGYHLIYFNPALPASVLLPDGTDPNQSPGPPFVRRMWAGGHLKINTRLSRKLNLDGRKYACVEGIRDVSVKGALGEEKIFVGIERRFVNVQKVKALKGVEGGDDEIRDAVWAADAWADADAEGSGKTDLDLVSFVERRNIVFMRERTEEELAVVREKGAAPAVEKMLKPQHPPTFTHTLTPTATLLFRYSALTFNAHAIHLDPSYCRDVEGHRNLLVHGPLSFTLLSLLLQNHIKSKSNLMIESIEYRNLAPLYCDEPLKLCGREKGENTYDLWAETPEGGIAVKATARVFDRNKE